MRGDTNRGLPLLRQRRVVDDEKTRVIADQAICLLQEGRLERNPVPHPGGDKMMKLIVADVANPRGHRLYALTVTWPDQTGNIERAHPAPRGMRKPCQNGSSHRSRSFRQVASTTIAGQTRQPILTRESTTIPAGSINLPK